MTITWIVQKKDRSGKEVGLSFTQTKDNIVVISEVSGRAAKKTDLVKGLKVLEIGGKGVTSANDATALVKKAPKGQLRIVTEGTHHSVTKTIDNDKPGFICQPSFELDGFYEISKVNQNGMFPDLVVGHILFSINGNLVDNEDDAIDILEKEMTIKLVVVDPNLYYGREPQTPISVSSPVSVVQTNPVKNSPPEVISTPAEIKVLGGTPEGMDIDMVAGEEMWC